MAVQSDFNLAFVATQTVQVASQQVSVTLQSAGPSGSLTGTTTPAASACWKGTLTVNGTTEIDLTALTLEVQIGLETTQIPVNFTGLKVLQAKFRTPISNGGTEITIAPGETNGYPIGSRTLEGNAGDGFFRPSHSNEVGASSKTIKFTSAATATIDVVLVAGE